jgi:hypothetical protein
MILGSHFTYFTAFFRCNLGSTARCPIHRFDHLFMHVQYLSSICVERNDKTRPFVTNVTLSHGVISYSK